jgi:CheY-like chemotaxis protein
MATILIADDETLIRALLKTVLLKAGHSIYEAANGLEAVAIFRSYAKDIDLVVMDMTMPVMNGAQAIERIRETRAEIRVICMSGYSDVEIPRGRFLQKPFDLKIFSSLVAEVLAG